MYYVATISAVSFSLQESPDTTDVSSEGDLMSYCGENDIDLDYKQAATDVEGEDWESRDELQPQKPSSGEQVLVQGHKKAERKKTTR